MDASTGDPETADDQPPPTDVTDAIDDPADSTDGTNLTDGTNPTDLTDVAATAEGTPSEIADSNRNRRRAALYSLPFLVLGIGSVTLILSWGLEPLWAFLLLPPILFMTGLTYLVFSTDFLENR